MTADPSIDIERILADEHARNQPAKRLPPLAAMARNFESLGDDRYRLAIADAGITLEIDRLRRERQELIGELSAWCQLPGARTVDGTLSIADFNLSGARSRLDRAKLLAVRANTGNGLDWTAIIEEFCQRVIQADRIGQPAVLLGKPDPAYRNDSMLDIDGLVIPRKHPSILFGDGGTCKSYIALRVLGTLAERGMRVMYIDWEFDRQDHEYRLARLFPDGIPAIFYVRCERALIHEADRLRRIVREERIEFAVFDSVAYACAGAPESSEVAGYYFRAARQVGIGGLHIAHVNKSEQGDKKPFGSVFWHNSARATWNVAADENADNPRQIALFNRKVNLDKLLPPVSYKITFTDHETTEFRRADIRDNADLADKLSLRQRMVHLLRRGSLTREQIAEELGAEYESVRRESNRNKKTFIVLQGGRVGLLDHLTENGTTCPGTGGTN